MKNALKKISIILMVVICMATTAIPNNMGIGLQTVEAASSVKINKSSATLIPGQKIQLKVSGTKSKIKWSSTKKSIATVNSKGKVTAKKKGSCYIIATIGKKQHKCKVSVTELTSLTLNKKSLSIYVGKGFQLKVAYKPKKVKLLDSDIKWSSSNKSIVSVNSKGYVRAHKKGTAYITAKVGKKIVKCKVTVKKKSIVYYINNRSVNYYDDEKVERLFWGFLDQDEEVTSSQGKVNIRIENNGENVYKKTFLYNESDFSNWTSRINGTQYLCSIDIPIEDIKPGKNNDGIIYYQVIDKDGSFDEFSLYIYNLPQKTISVTFPKVPISVLDKVSLYDSIIGNRREGLCNINIQKIDIDKDNSSLKLKFIGNVTPFIDEVTWTFSHNYNFSVVLMKGDVVVSTNWVRTPEIYLNQKFECETSFYGLDNCEEYSLYIRSY